jgi:hypothetical protein
MCSDMQLCHVVTSRDSACAPSTHFAFARARETVLPETEIFGLATVREGDLSGFGGRALQRTAKRGEPNQVRYGFHFAS